MVKQLNLNIYKGKKGGRRPGSGRKRIHSKGVAHRTRESMNAKTPLHINFRYRTTIRNKTNLRLLKRAILNSRSHGLKIIHFSLQTNHVHLIVEATDNQTLSKGMRSLTITFAKRLKRGRVQIERYHLHVLRSLRETKNAVHYVLFNEQKHSGLKKAYVDQYSSLGLVKSLRKLAQEARMTVIMRKLNEMVSLDLPESWLARASLDLSPHPLDSFYRRS